MKILLYKNYEPINLLEPISNNYTEDDEVAKNFAFSLQIPKGSFILDKTIGSNFLYKIKQLSSKNFKDKLFFLIQEVSSSFQLINIKNVEYFPNKKLMSLSILITFTINNNNYLISMEVSI